MRPPARIALYRGPERAATLRAAFEAVAEGVDWSAPRRVLIKPNLVVPDRPLAVTHPAALEVALAAVRARYGGEIVVAEGSALTATKAAFEHYGLPELCARFEARLVDLNADDTAPFVVVRASGGPLELRMARTVLESDFRISLAVPKAHDTVLVTLGIKNMIMGGLVNRRVTESRPRAPWHDRLGRLHHGHGDGWGSDKMAMHQGYPVINLNLALLAGHVLPHLTLLDGHVAMEGAGPIDGEAVPWRVAIAGTDALAVDLFTADLMGFPRPQVGYLDHCATRDLGQADPASWQVVGNVAPGEVRRDFRPHPGHRGQRRWAHPHAAELLAQHGAG